MNTDLAKLLLEGLQDQVAVDVDGPCVSIDDPVDLEALAKFMRRRGWFMVSL